MNNSIAQFTKSQVTKFTAARNAVDAEAARTMRVMGCGACLAYLATLGRGELPESISPLY